MYSRKIISFPLVAIAAVALIFGAGQVSAQIQEQGTHLDDFTASCQTPWNGHSWDRCESDHVTAETSFEATFCVTAPACAEACYPAGQHNSASRYGLLYRTDFGQAITQLHCPGGSPCPQCCRTYHWQTENGVTYYVQADNIMTDQSCGPTKASFKGGNFNCVYD